MSKTIESSTRGTIEITNTGLIHRANKGAYSGRVAEMNTECIVVDKVKRGRGRPKTENSANGFYDFSAFMTPVKLKKHVGTVTVVKARV